MKVEIKTDNEAFTENKARECARILHEVAEKLESGSWPYPVRGQRYPLYDVNGNKVGNCRR